MKKVLLGAVLLLGISSVISCNKDGEGEGAGVSEEKLEGKSWIAESTSYLVNGNPTQTVPGLIIPGWISRDSYTLTFKDGYVSLKNKGGEEMYPYVIEGNVVKVISPFGTVLNLSITDISKTKLTAVVGEKYPRELKEDSVSSPYPLVSYNGTDVFYNSYSISEYSSGYALYYYDEKGICIGCSATEGESQHREAFISYYRQFSAETLTTEEIFSLFGGLIRWCFEKKEDYDKIKTIAIDEIGATEVQNILFLVSHTSESYSGLKNALYALTYDYRTGGRTMERFNEQYPAEPTHEELAYRVKHCGHEKIEYSFIYIWEYYSIFYKYNSVFYTDGQVELHFKAE